MEKLKKATFFVMGIIILQIKIAVLSNDNT